jgi:transcriptional regulator with XRE-family HTH domain
MSRAGRKKMAKKYPIDLNEVGNRLKAVREELKLTIDQMREISGYSKSLISSAENGLKKPSVLYLFALYDRYNVSIHYILNGKGPMFLPLEEEKPEAPDHKREEASEEFIQSDDNIRHLLYLMEHVDMVRFAVLSHFIEYKTQHKRLIDELLEEKRENVKKLTERSNK